MALLLAVSIHSTTPAKPSQEIDYVAPIERWIDTAFVPPYGKYGRDIESRHLREKSHDPDIRPTWHNSPFVKPHGLV